MIMQSMDVMLSGGSVKTLIPPQIEIGVLTSLVHATSSALVKTMEESTERLRRVSPDQSFKSIYEWTRSKRWYEVSTDQSLDDPWNKTLGLEFEGLDIAVNYLTKSQDESWNKVTQILNTADFNKNGIGFKSIESRKPVRTLMIQVGIIAEEWASYWGNSFDIARTATYRSIEAWQHLSMDAIKRGVGASKQNRSVSSWVGALTQSKSIQKENGIYHLVDQSKFHESTCVNPMPLEGIEAMRQRAKALKKAKSGN